MTINNICAATLRCQPESKLIKLKLPDLRVITLQRFGPAVSLPESHDTLYRGHCCSDRGYIRYLVFDGRLADVGVVVFAQTPGRRINHQLNLAVLDGINDVRPALVHL